MNQGRPEWYQLRDALERADFSAAATLLQSDPCLIDERNGIGETGWQKPAKFIIWKPGAVRCWYAAIRFYLKTNDVKKPVFFRAFFILKTETGALSDCRISLSKNF